MLAQKVILKAWLRLDFFSFMKIIILDESDKNNVPWLNEYSTCKIFNEYFFPINVSFNIFQNKIKWLWIWYN